MSRLDPIDEWKARSEQEQQRLESFITSTKLRKQEQVDRVALQSHVQASEAIDCLQCGNCCRTSVTDFKSTDIKRAAAFLGVSKKQFIHQYLIEDADVYITITTPCPFLNLGDNKCKIYEARPDVCRSYPHTQKKDFAARTHAHRANLNMCPITYHVVKKMQAAIGQD